MLGPDLVGLEGGQALEAHIEDGLSLFTAQFELFYKSGSGDVGVGRSADQCDHGIEVVERNQQAFENMGPCFCPAQLELGTTGNYFALVLDVVPDHVAQAEGLRHTFDQRDHVHAERGLELGLLEQVVENDVRDRATLQLDYDAHAGPVGLVPQVGDAFQFLVANQTGDLDDETGVATLLHRVRQFGDDQGVLAALERFGVDLAAHPDTAASGGVGLPNVARVHDSATGEVRALDVFHQAFKADFTIVDVGGHGAGDFAQVVWRNVGCHADRDTGGTVDQQVGET